MVLEMWSHQVSAHHVVPFCAAEAATTQKAKEERTAAEAAAKKAEEARHAEEYNRRNSDGKEGLRPLLKKGKWTPKI